MKRFKCGAYWVIDNKNQGTCRKFNPTNNLCFDTNEPCPYKGVKDFETLINKREFDSFTEKCHRGAKNSHMKIKMNKLTLGKVGDR